MKINQREGAVVELEGTGRRRLTGVACRNRRKRGSREIVWPIRPISNLARAVARELSARNAQAAAHCLVQARRHALSFHRSFSIPSVLVVRSVLSRLSLRPRLTLPILCTLFPITHGYPHTLLFCFSIFLNPIVGHHHILNPVTPCRHSIIPLVFSTAVRRSSTLVTILLPFKTSKHDHPE